MCKSIRLFVCLVFLVHKTTSTEVIYRLSDEDYAKMPVLVHADRFTHCLNQPHGVYCTAHADVVADGPSELLDMMRGFSEHTAQHYNHTRLRYGLCVTGTCKRYYNGTGYAELQVAVEACLNHTLSQDYELKTRVTKFYCYHADKTEDNKYPVDWVDWAVAAAIVAIVVANVVGSVYDVYRDQNKPGNKVLVSFSLRRNWRQLMAPPSADPRAAALQSLNGVRFLTCCAICGLHLTYETLTLVEDTKLIEQRFEHRLYHLLANGHLLTQSFFLMSGFLLAYNTQVSAEKQPLTWSKYVKSIILRYVRLSTVGMVSVTLAATFLRFGTKGPFWQDLAGVEVDDCRRYWLYNLLMIFNYGDSQCQLPTWSSASDFHLHVVALTVMLVVRDARSRRWVLFALLAVGLLWPMYTVYKWDTDGTVIGGPEMGFVVLGDTFKHLYMPTHNNIPVFVVGLLFGELVYELQARRVTEQDHTEYRFVYWLLLPLMGAVLVAPTCFYAEEPRKSQTFRALFTLTKPLYGLVVGLIVFGAVLKVENVYRRILEWSGWVPLAKLSYCVYSLHMLTARYVAGARPTLVTSVPPHVSVMYFGVMSLVLAASLAVHLCVEAPVSHVAKMALAERRATENKENKTE